jgi:stearoyl-CoA desaturase (delta-9 desaturase)
MNARRTQRLEQRVALWTIVVPTVGSVAALIHGVVWGVPTHAATSFGVLYVLTMLGITGGFHRLVTHRSFRTPSWVRDALVVLGSMSAQGPVVFWSVAHRRHHEASDAPGDPHSPHRRGEDVITGWRGFLHAQLGWMLQHQAEDVARYGKDLLRDRRLLRLSFLYPVWVALGFAIPALVGLVVERSLSGAIAGFLFGGCLRVFAVHQATWLVNSICHSIGARAYRTGDESRNVPLVALLTLGEGWHNNHHAFPTSARHGLAWWQLDFVYLAIKALETFSLADSVRVPSEGELKRKQRVQAPSGVAEGNLES